MLKTIFYPALRGWSAYPGISNEAEPGRLGWATLVANITDGMEPILWFGFVKIKTFQGDIIRQNQKSIVSLNHVPKYG